MSARLDDDSGMSLVELLVAAFVGAVVLAVVATVFVSTLQANASARDRDLSTGRVQAISTSLSTSIRDASFARIETAAGDGTVLRARVAKGASAWTCRAWAVVDLTTTDAGGVQRPGADGRFELRYREYDTLATGATAPAPAAGWSVLAEHVEPTSDASGTLSSFAISGSRVSWDLAVSTAEQPQLSEGSLSALSGGAALRAFQEGGRACW